MIKFIKNTIFICVVHYVWVMLIVLFCIGWPSFNDTLDFVLRFMTEPWIIGILWTALIYRLIAKYMKRNSCNNAKANILIWAVSIILTLHVLIWVFGFYVEYIKEEGFSVFIYI